MDRTGIIVVSICAILFGVWFIEMQKYQSHLPPPQRMLFRMGINLGECGVA